MATVRILVLAAVSFGLLLPGARAEEKADTAGDLAGFWHGERRVDGEADVIPLMIDIRPDGTWVSHNFDPASERVGSGGAGRVVRAEGVVTFYGNARAGEGQRRYSFQLVTGEDRAGPLVRRRLTLWSSEQKLTIVLSQAE